MKKIHLQVIEKMATDPLPGPGRYVSPSTFGKVGIHFSMRPNTVVKLDLRKIPYNYR